jgi:single-strand DNA-binding protein
MKGYQTMSYSSITIVGRLGRDPEMSYTTSGQANTKFSVATDRGYTGSDGQPVKETSWFRVTVWGKQAESCNKYLKKGQMVLVEGRLTCDSKTGGPRIWTRQDGTPNASFEISANTVRFLSSKPEKEESTEAAGEEGGGDVPF